jgi:hypothetical protein
VAVAALAAAICVGNGAARGEEFLILGGRAMGMGGAGVAVTRGSSSQYWNPAALAPPRTAQLQELFDLEIEAGATFTAAGDALEELDEVVEIAEEIDFADIEDRLSNGDLLTQEQVEDLMRLAAEVPELGEEGTGIAADLGLGVDLRLWRFGIGALGTFHGGAVTVLDRTTLALGTMGIDDAVPVFGDAPVTPAGMDFAQELEDTGLVTEAQAEQIAFYAEQAGVNLADQDFRELVIDVLEATAANDGGSLDNLLTNNRSGVELRGIFVQELGLGYSQPLADIADVAPFNWVSVGATVKAMGATTYYNPFTLAMLPDFGDVASDITSDAREETSFNVGVDTGVLVQPFDWLSLGVVGRNLNGPSFEFEGPGDYELDPQVRAGVGFIGVLPGLVLAADVDLTRNQSDAFPGRRSQILGGGLEYSVAEWDVLFLRLGASTNLAEADESVAFHFGIGLRLGGVSLDLAGMISPEFTSIESDEDGEGDAEEVPERAGAGIQLGVFVPID